MDAKQVQTTVMAHVSRVSKSDFQQIGATEIERDKLDDANVTAKPAQDYAAWRRSVLLCASVCLLVACVFQWSGYESFESQLAEIFKPVLTEAANRAANTWDGQGRRTVDDKMVLEATRKHVGVDNLETLDAMQKFLLGAFAVVALCVLLAAQKWTDVQASRKYLRVGALLLVGAPMVIALIPWMRVLDFSHLDAAARKQLEGFLGLGLGLSMFMMVAPKIVGLFPGIMRASMTLKTMLHESPTPGYLAVMAAPIFVILLLMMFTTINQMQGSMQLLFGLASLGVGSGVYVWRAKDLLRSHSKEEANTVVREIRKTAFLFTVVGIALIAFWIFNLDVLKAEQAVEFLATAGGGLLLMMVAGADFIVNVVEREYHLSKTFVASGGAKEFEEKIAGLQDAGFVTAPVIQTDPEVFE